MESAGNYMNFVLTRSKILSRMSMEETLDILPKEKFIRIHRSFIIAIDKIEKADRHKVWINNIGIPIGSSFEEGLCFIKNK